jgi:hypothetical protein
LRKGGQDHAAQSTPLSGDNLGKARLADLGGRGAIFAHGLDFLRFDRTSRSPPPRSKHRASGVFSPCTVLNGEEAQVCPAWPLDDDESVAEAMAEAVRSATGLCAPPQDRHLPFAGIRQRLYALVPGFAAAYFFFLALTLAHGGGRELAPLVLAGLGASLGAGAYILVVGAPGIMRSWRRWIYGLLVAMVLFVGAALVLIPQYKQ